MGKAGTARRCSTRSECLKAQLVNFDGIIGPTHNYSGLSPDNLASASHRGEISRPKDAALQGLYKMKLLHDFGLKQGVLPPHERPEIMTLRRFGFTGTDDQVLLRAADEAPDLVRAVSSASAAWAANAAVVSPSADTADGRVQITPANLISRFHRSIEPLITGYALTQIFPDPETFLHHEALPGFGDEGAANWLRLSKVHGEPGVELFVYGGRQSRLASEALIRTHRLEHALLVELNPEMIACGIFHNDLVALSERHLLIHYEGAWLREGQVLSELKERLAKVSKCDLQVITIPKNELPLHDLIDSYLLNSQLVTRSDGTMALVCPKEVRENIAAQHVVEWIVSEKNPIEKVLYFDLSESMGNGGGPACLRLPAILTDSELASTHQGCLLNDALYQELVEWVNKNYRDTLHVDELADPALMHQTRVALDELCQILDLEPLYPFQML